MECDENTPPIPSQIDGYKIKSQIGRGGMGDVFLAEDPLVNREVALKCIRSDLTKYPQMQRRFEREGYIAAQLSHPAIIPIFSRVNKKNTSYYTMPYIRGDTLKERLKEAKKLFKQGEESRFSSIPHLMRIFLSICQGVAYAHSRGVLHRDLKPENILIGNYGEVLIFDWGLASGIDEKDPDLSTLMDPLEVPPSITRVGKVIGTLAYLAPERVLEKKTSVQTEIYCLGVTLYQLLTFKMPFKRATVKEFKRTAIYERYVDPMEAAPSRDIPLQLSLIVKRCLAFDPDDRYANVDELIADIDAYMEGQPNWTLSGNLKTDRREDWEFQEMVFLNTLIANVPSKDMMKWAHLMVSSQAYSGNLKIEALVKIKKGSQGVGFILNIPEAKERKSIQEGICFWIGSRLARGVRVYKSQVQITQNCDFFLEEEKAYFILLERVDQRISLSINGECIINYSSSIPFLGSHLGLMLLDMEHEFTTLKVYSGGRNLMVNCLSIPDAFLALRQFDYADAEYARIAASFPGRAEGRDAEFRRGITLIEKANTLTSKEEKTQILDRALCCFNTLKEYGGTPLEYLGKSLIYKSLHERGEEIKCLELGLRKYHAHPQISILYEHVFFRLHECCNNDRRSAIHLALIAIQHIKALEKNPDIQQLIYKLCATLTPHDRFFREIIFAKREELPRLALHLAFLLERPYQLIELFSHGLSRFESPLEAAAITLYYLLHLDEQELIDRFLDSLFLQELITEKRKQEIKASFSTLIFEPKDVIDEHITLFNLESLPPHPATLSKLPLLKRQQEFAPCLKEMIDLLSLYAKNPDQVSQKEDLVFEGLCSPRGSKALWEESLDQRFSLFSPVFPQYVVGRLKENHPEWDALFPREKAILKRYLALYEHIDTQ